MPRHNDSSRTATVEALLFDSDGVLVDSDDSVVQAWSQWAVEQGLDPDGVVDRVHGRRAADTVAELIEPADRPRALRRINDLELAAADTVRALPGADALLAGLEGIPWAVVTSATRALAVARLRAAGLPRPEILITADDLREGKPSPEGYQTAADRLGKHPSHCVVFEDSPAGVLAAHAAGVGTVVGVALRQAESQTWARVSDLRSISCRRLDSGRVELRADAL